MDRADIVHESFLRRVAAQDFPEGPAASGPLSAAEAVAIYRAQVTSRALDRTSRAMQKTGRGYYTIGSSGHEGMAAVAQALQTDDPAFLHYRDGAFQIARANRVPGQNVIRDMLFSFACSSDDPISGGRHKVLGSKALSIPPQTSTIASHLPKAVGAAYSIGLAKRHAPEHQLYPNDAIVIASFGDASANHSTAQGAFNSAGWTSVQSAPLPLLFVCEDNGIGISVKTPTGWIEASLGNRPGIKYFKADGLTIYETYQIAKEAADYVRTRRKPAFLHLRMVRLYGHAGADVPTSYLSRDEIEADEANDPLLHTVRLLNDNAVLKPQEALTLYSETCLTVGAEAEKIKNCPHLETATDVMASLVPPKRICRHQNEIDPSERAEVLGREVAQMEEPQPMSRLINWALYDLMNTHPEIVLIGEDIGRKGGVYGVTQRLQSRFGPDRVIDSLLDEQAILGMSIGLAQNGFIPIPEIQFLAYLHNAEDQIRGEAATLPFFSNGQFSNPMVVRIAGLGYQKGFGGHFHNDNSFAVLRDIPGVVIACPSNGSDAAMMLRECVRLAREEQRVCIFLEPIALYPMRDLVEEGDNAWMSPYPDPALSVGFGEIGCHGSGKDLAIVTYGNGYHLARQAALILRERDSVNLRVIDLRWLAPLPRDVLLDTTSDCAAILIVDECRQTGSLSEALVTLLSEFGKTRVSRVVAQDSFIATGPAFAATLPSVSDIVSEARILTNSS